MFVTTADTAGLLRRQPDEDTLPGQLLTDLKDLRRNVRHRAAEGPVLGSTSTARKW